MPEWSKSTESGEQPIAMEWDSRFRAAIADDLDLPAVMALVVGLVRSEISPSSKAELLTRWDSVLGLDLNRPGAGADLPFGAAALLAEREKARAARDFARSDQLRAELRRLGVTVGDEPLEKN